MRYYVTLGGRAFTVELSDDGATIDGQPVQADFAAIPGTPVRHLLADGRSYALVARAGQQRGLWDLHIDGRRFAAEVVDERTRVIRAMTGASATATRPRPVRAPMPGLVIRTEVEAGQLVEPGQGVVIIEAMKMENELKAESAARVALVCVQAGQTVEKGAILVEFDAVPPSGAV